MQTHGIPRADQGAGGGGGPRRVADAWFPTRARPAQHSLVLDHDHAVEVATFLRDDPELQLDYCSNVTGVDWLDRVEKTKVKVTQGGRWRGEGGRARREEETIPGYLEAVYHLYSIEKKHGPVVIRLRTDGAGSEAGHPAVAHAGLARRGVPGARDLRPLRDRLHGPPGPAAHPDVGRVRGLPDAAGLRRRRTTTNTSRPRTTPCSSGPRRTSNGGRTRTAARASSDAMIIACNDTMPAAAPG